MSEVTKGNLTNGIDPKKIEDSLCNGINSEYVRSDHNPKYIGSLGGI